MDSEQCTIYESLHSPNRYVFQDARRPFSNVNPHLHPPYGPGVHYSDPFLAGGGGATYDDSRSVLERLKRESESRNEAFSDKVRVWDATRPRQEDIDEQLKVRKYSMFLI